MHRPGTSHKDPGATVTGERHLCFELGVGLRPFCLLEEVGKSRG